MVFCCAILYACCEVGPIPTFGTRHSLLSYISLGISQHTLRLLTAMTTTHYTAEHIPATVDSVVSSPRSDHPSVDNSRVYDDTTAQARVRFMCSFGGKILPRPHDNQLRYVGGDTRMVTVLRHNTTFSSLLNKLSKLSGKKHTSIAFCTVSVGQKS